MQAVTAGFAVASQHLDQAFLEQQFQQTVNALVEKRFAQLSPHAEAVAIDHDAGESTAPSDDLS